MNVEPIGIVKSTITEVVEHKWSEVPAEIHLMGSLASGLQGIEDFSHAVVIFYLHKAPPFDAANHLIHHVQGRPDLPEVGVFAQRGGSRPNPIGVATVQLLSVERNVIRVKGLDAIDGTPILDIKPYIPFSERTLGSRAPEWVNHLIR